MIQRIGTWAGWAITALACTVFVVDSHAGGSIADRPAIQGGDNSRIAHEQHLTKAKIGKGKIDVYFEGDSIFRRWGCSDPTYANYLKNWNENFFGWNAGDFAWGADTIQNILWRLQNGEIDDVNPKVVVFLGGTNNVNPGANVEDLTKGLTACFDTIHKKAPDATLIIVGILPRTPAGDMPVINKINDNLAKLADGKKVRFVNVNDKFIDKDGKMIPGMLNNDNLHPDTKGYQAIADAIKPILTEILGPPAKEDHAPPPTGDPKVRPDYPPK
jgi:lysophospholipase L1-like esterase